MHMIHFHAQKFLKRGSLKSLNVNLVKNLLYVLRFVNHQYTLLQVSTLTL